MQRRFNSIVIDIMSKVTNTARSGAWHPLQQSKVWENVYAFLEQPMSWPGSYVGHIVLQSKVAGRDDKPCLILVCV